MNVFITSFWGEGVSDERFLPGITQRVITSLLSECAQGEWDVYEPVILHSNADSFVNQVLDIALKSKGYNAMFIHTDADARNENESAIPHKIHPALEELSRQNDEFCKYLVPVIPVFKVENWKLCDGDALREALGVPLNNEEMGININIQTLEQRSGSKEMLRDILKMAKQRSRFAPDAEDIDYVLAKQISLENLMRLTSFKAFVHRLKTTLISQNIITPNCDFFPV